MPLISDETALQLIELGVLDSDLNITPNAYVGAISRKPVNEQGKLMGIPVLFRPFRKNGGDPETQAISFLKKRVYMFLEGGEGYVIKSFLSKIIPQFDYRKKTHNYTANEIEKQIEHIHKLTDYDIVKACEIKEYGFNIGFKFDDNGNQESEITEKFLKNRFKTAKVVYEYPVSDEQIKEDLNYFKSKERESVYIKSLSTQLELWHSLRDFEWHALSKLILRNWDKIYTGWPDITLFSRKIGLTLLEIKGDDKIHASQIFTILKLKEVLGANRIAILWMNSAKTGYSGLGYSQHKTDIIEWFNTYWENRKQIDAKRIRY